jgi:glycosyltransferase involved in cell wall biosynthesis
VAYLPDPVRIMACSPERTQILRTELRIGPERKVLLLFGDFRGRESLERKGVAQTLAAVRALPEDTARQCCLLFAGQMSEETTAWVEREFAMIQRTQPVECRLINRYIAEEEVQAIFHLADLVMIPYQRHVGMSGVLVRAAAAEVPVLASDYGLVGALVPQHRLGWVIDGGRSSAFAEMLTAFFRQGLPPTFDIASAQHFAESHSGDKFSSVLLEGILSNA